MLLALDIGNTLTKGALFEGKEILRSFAFATKKESSSGEIILSLKAFLSNGDGLPNVNTGVVSSVVSPLGRRYEKAIHDLFGFVPKVLGQGEQGVAPTDVDDYREVGADILCLARAASKFYGTPAFVADLGTADKFVYVDKEGRMAGLSIGAGLKISAEALAYKTSALTETSLKIPSSPLGKNTYDCLDSGLLYGVFYKTKGFLQAFEEIAGQPLKRILTGGNASFIKELLPDFSFDPHLVLKGLADYMEEQVGN